MTLISVAVVSIPVNAHQSLTTRPEPITSDPRFTVPACGKAEWRVFSVMEKEDTYNQWYLK